MSNTLKLPKASLLGIPTELRFQIYDHLLSTDINWTVLKGYKDAYTKQGFHATPIPGDDENPLLSLPWLHLLQTCKSLSCELQSYIRREGTKANAAASTYTVDIQCLARGDLGAITWRTIPCPPTHAKTLVATCNFDRAQAQFQGDGGPLPIKRHLYQTLNRFLHLGPRLNNRAPLPRHLCLQRLEVHVLVRGEPAPAPATPEDQDPRGFVEGDGWGRSRAYRGVAGLMWPLEATGLIGGYVGELRLTNGRVGHWTGVRAVGDAKVPEAWRRYGFEWGAEGGGGGEGNEGV
ncbi:hypothetical protein EJ03DRAFT_348047 [Teratosphaeria nubilosa]|uniref:F-box domain-containing protein n=1 Tax=Teratosphaeria nubilosa TaxID=161662 RepID=A0A6G1LJE1_9PEZI|nr:hypothetical protein EJ03DRAFT_348047 [Teratosphaeria nubilosa]